MAKLVVCWRISVNCRVPRVFVCVLQCKCVCVCVCVCVVPSVTAAQSRKAKERMKWESDLQQLDKQRDMLRAKLRNA